MSRFSQRVGCWFGMLLKKAIKPDARATQSYCPISTEELVERMIALESLAKTMSNQIMALGDSMAIAELNLDLLNRSSSTAQTTEKTGAATESITATPAALKKVILH
jgi:hypothetical protein